MITELMTKTKVWGFLATRHLHHGSLHTIPVSLPFLRLLILFAVAVSMNSESKQI